MESLSTPPKSPVGYSVTLARFRRFQTLLFIFIGVVYFLIVIYSLVNSFFFNPKAEQNDSNGTENSPMDSDEESDVLDHSVKEINVNSPLQNTSTSYFDNNFCKDGFCVDKCCRVNESFGSTEGNICVFDSFLHLDEGSFVEKVLGILNQNIPESNSSRGYLFFNNTCGSNKVKKFDLRDIRLLDDGTFALRGKIFIEDTFCVDFIVGSNTIFISGCGREEEITEEQNERDQSVFDKHEDLIICVVILSLAVSKILIVATLAIYMCIPELRNIHGKILINYLISVMLFDVSMIGFVVYDKIFENQTNIMDFVSTVALISWMTWLTIMCFDIWILFSHPLKAHPHLHDNSRKFRVYSLIGWGSIVLHSILELAVVLIDDSYSITRIFSKFAVTLNVVMFVSTLVNFRFHRAKTSSSCRHGQSGQEGFFLYAKLSVLMGLDWLLVIVCIRTGTVIGLFIAFVIIECQGITLFVLLVCNKRVLHLLRQNRKKRKFDQNRVQV